MILDAVALVLERVLPFVPGRLVAPISEIAGTVAYLAAPRARAAVRSNHLVIAPGRRPRVRRTFVNQVRNYLETFRLMRLDRSHIERDVDVAGWERAVQALEDRRGIVFATAHFGPVIVVGQILMARGLEVTVPLEPKSDPLGRAIDRARSRFGARFVDTTSAMAIARVLRHGGILGVLADRAVTGVGEVVEFFGRPALLPSAHVALALRTGAPLLPGFAHRRDGRLVAELEPPIALERTADREADLRRGVRAFAQVMERHIAEAPEEWANFQPVWDRGQS
ncbi:MAG TPA: lysophospholipid acyltransferase family protein [Candidatus Limnocylindria bacterium]|nr:lysophospholipid acyltransferase family protein [Candidatus Limnocylindria bacterium]